MRLRLVDRQGKTTAPSCPAEKWQFCVLAPIPAPGITMRITDSWQTNLYLVAGRCVRAMNAHLPKPAHPTSVARARVRVCSMEHAVSCAPPPLTGPSGASIVGVA